MKLTLVVLHRYGSDLEPVALLVARDLSHLHGVGVHTVPETDEDEQKQQELLSLFYPEDDGELHEQTQYDVKAAIDSVRFNAEVEIIFCSEFI